MKIKPVYSIRITKNDTDMKEYLQQFPESKQNQALKEIIKYGIISLKKDYQINQELENKLKEQDEKLNKIIQLLQNVKIKNNSFEQIDEEKEKENSIDFEKTKETMKEALSMFFA